ncbi:TPA: DNA repair protein RadC [Providencia rettgeri]|nr:DNA repair protein RadC [Providencia rettgeri]
MQAKINEVREYLSSRLYLTDQLTSPQTTYDFLAVQLGDKEQEVFSVIYLNAQNQVIQYVEMFNGTINHTNVYPREIAKLALKLNAASIICAHNHPSGTVTPSKSDIKITDKLKTVMQLFDITLLDHIIVAGGETMSFAEKGLL